MYKVGQCIKGCIPFEDGVQSLYDRPYVIIKTDPLHQMLHILNISSSAGKEHKLLRSSNILLKKSIPPLRKSSFVKIDSCQQISFADARSFRLMSDGQLLHQEDLYAVLTAYSKLKI